MELTGLQIFKYLPGAKKTENANCKKCGCPTCMAYALKLAKKNAKIDDCPYIPDELNDIFSEVSKVQQHTIRLKNDDSLVVGGETVMFRHDKTFVNKTVIAVTLDVDSKSFEKDLERVRNYKIERIGETFKVDAIYLKGEKDFSDVLSRVVESGFAVITDKKLSCAIDNKSLLDVEDYTNLDRNSNIIVRGDNIDELIANSNIALKDGFKNVVLKLSSENKTVSEVIEELTHIRRYAINQRFEPLTYPVMVEISKDMDLYKTCAFASLLICRYANMIVLNNFDEALLTTLFTLRQNIYTNPQKPLQVEAKVYEFNDPDENSPVLLTTNFALTYFAVAGELESLPFGSYLVVTPSDGMSVLTAWSADKFTAELVAKSIADFGLAAKVKNRSIIIPGLLAHMQDELQKALPDWSIIVGTVEACQIPDFLKQISNDKKNS